MGYVTNTLAPGEEYVYRAKFNWTYDFESWFWFLLGCFPMVLWAFQYFENSSQSNLLNYIFSIAITIAFVLGALLILQRYLQKWTTVIAVTSFRLIFKKGLVARDSHEVNLDKIEEVLVHQSFMGRILGYGVLTVRGTGIAVIEFPKLARPMEIRREIETAVINARHTFPAAVKGVVNNMENSNLSKVDLVATV